MPKFVSTFELQKEALAEKRVYHVSSRKSLKLLNEVSERIQDIAERSNFKQSTTQEKQGQVKLNA